MWSGYEMGVLGGGMRGKAGRVDRVNLEDFPTADLSNCAGCQAVLPSEVQSWLSKSCMLTMLSLGTMRWEDDVSGACAGSQLFQLFPTFDFELASNFQLTFG